MSSLGFDAVWINGSVGSGKSTTAEALGEELEGRGIPGAVIDVDALRRAWPAPAGDPFNSALARANVRAVAGVFRSHGARVIVAAGVIEDADEVALLASALGAERMLHVRLTVEPAVAAERLRGRHGTDGAGLEWHLRRHPELAGILEAAAFVDELVIDTTEAGPEEVAAAIADLVRSS